MQSLIFLTEKRDGAKKGKMSAKGSTQRSCFPKEESSSPMVITESVLITSVIDAKQERDVVLMDIPSAFSHAKVPKGDERIAMKIRRALEDMLLEIDPEKTKTS